MTSAQDLASLLLSKTVECPDCGGRGNSIARRSDCPTCNAIGRILKPQLAPLREVLLVPVGSRHATHYETIPHSDCQDPKHCDCECPVCARDKVLGPRYVPRDLSMLPEAYRAAAMLGMLEKATTEIWEEPTYLDHLPSHVIVCLINNKDGTDKTKLEALCAAIAAAIGEEA